MSTVIAEFIHCCVQLECELVEVLYWTPRYNNSRRDAESPLPLVSTAGGCAPRGCGSLQPPGPRLHHPSPIPIITRWHLFHCNNTLNSSQNDAPCILPSLSFSARHLSLAPEFLYYSHHHLRTPFYCLALRFGLVTTTYAVVWSILMRS